MLSQHTMSYNVTHQHTMLSQHTISYNVKHTMLSQQTMSRFRDCRNLMHVQHIS